MTARTTQIIKQSIAYRAKYRVEFLTKKTYSPLLVVPHPKNRGGDPVKSLCTMLLNGTITDAGYDPIEANANAVAVQEKPVTAGGSGTRFQDAFAKELKTDPDMLERGEGMVAIAGSLSHGHLNYILGGKKGCECPEGTTKCVCLSSRILDEKGNYTLVKVEAHDEAWKVEAHDEAWARACLTGLVWKTLCWKMDDEEPGAAQIISIALNR